MLEWLVALRLKSLCGKPLADVPIFSEAASSPHCPLWYMPGTIKFPFSTIVPDINGKKVVDILKYKVAHELCLPVKEFRGDIS